MPDIRISRSDDGQFVWLNRNGVTSTFQTKDWFEFVKLVTHFTVTGVKEMKNYEDLPTRTPLHANTPRVPRSNNPKASLDDLV